MSYKETIEVKNMFYFANINEIGGVESFFYNLARKYKSYDILILYNSGDSTQIRRLMKYVRVERYSGQYIVCEKAFFNYSIGSIIGNVKADEYIQIIHADYAAQGIAPKFDERITRYLCVSNAAKESFEKLTGKKAEVAYNPLAYIRPKRVLKLVSATRLTKEKGRDRITALAKCFRENGIQFEWLIFTNDTKSFSEPGIQLRKSILNICDYISDADYLVQLSDTEAYCYSVVEALTLGTPVIVTPIPVFEELGVVNGENAFYVPFDMKDIPVKAIYESRLKFTYKPVQDCWKDILAPGKSQYQDLMKVMTHVKATRDYYDMELGYLVKTGELLNVSKVRAKQLVSAGVAEEYELGDT